MNVHLAYRVIWVLFSGALMTACTSRLVCELQETEPQSTAVESSAESVDTPMPVETNTDGKNTTQDTDASAAKDVTAAESVQSAPTCPKKMPNHRTLEQLRKLKKEYRELEKELIVQNTRLSRVELGARLIGHQVGKLNLPAASYASGIRIYNFWAKWCAPCVEELPSLLALRDKTSEGQCRQVYLLSVNSDRDTDVSYLNDQFPQEVFYSLPEVAKDQTFKTLANDLPATIAVDESGTVLWAKHAKLDAQDLRVLRRLCSSQSP